MYVLDFLFSREPSAMRTVLVYRAVTKYVTLKNTVVYKI